MKNVKSPPQTKIGQIKVRSESQARRIVLGRGIMLEEDSMNTFLRKYSRELLPHEVQMYQMVIDSIKAAKQRLSEKEVKKKFLNFNHSIWWKIPCKVMYYPSQLEAVQLFKNECSFIFGALGYFSPGLFPRGEIDAYEAIGRVLLRE